MVYDFNGKSIRIPDTYIQSAIDNLSLTKEEAIQMYLDDEGYTVNDEQQELIEKAKKAGRINGNAKADRERKPVKRERKPNDEKRAIIEKVQQAFSDIGAVIANPEREVTFTIDGNAYSITLIAHRKPKE